ncbi:MAG: hypothetical protein KGJ98_12115 [Chloroflexota bacterium]|nr:hypothetical protein [Chloroflexota bacterium]
MNVPDPIGIFNGIGNALEMAGRDPVRFALALMFLTIFADVYGDALLIALDRLQRVLATPDEFSRTLAPLVEDFRPPAILRSLGLLLVRADRVLGDPIRKVGWAWTFVGNATSTVSSWPVNEATTPVGSTACDLANRAERRLTAWSAALQKMFAAGVAELRGPTGTWAGSRVAGAIIFLAVSAAFLFADSGIAIRTEMSATGEPTQLLPGWLVQNLPLQLAIASFGATLALGIVLFDLLKMHSLAPFDRLTPVARMWLVRLSALLLGLALTLAAMVALWRSDALMDGAWLSPEVRTSALGLSLTLPIVLLLATTALTAWGVVAAGIVAVLVVDGILIATVEVLRVGAIIGSTTSVHISNGVALALRGLGTAVLVLSLVPIALATIPLYGVVVAGTLVLLVLFTAVVGGWWLAWSGLRVAALLLDLQARATAAMIEVVKASIDVLRAPVVKLRKMFRSQPSASMPRAGGRTRAPRRPARVVRLDRHVPPEPEEGGEAVVAGVSRSSSAGSSQNGQVG